MSLLQANHHGKLHNRDELGPPSQRLRLKPHSRLTVSVPHCGCLLEIKIFLKMAEKLSQRISNKKFLLVRILLFLASAAYVIINPLLLQDPKETHLVYLTNWSWIFNALYFLVGVIQLLMINKSRAIDWSWKCLFSIVQPLAIFVTVLFWALLSDLVTDPATPLGTRFRSGLEHILNFVVVFIDLLLSSTQIPLIFVLAPINFILIYSVCIICWRILVENSFWPYDFLNIVVGSRVSSFNWLYTVLFVLGLVLFVVLLFFVVIGITKLRDRKRKPEVKQATSSTTIVVV